jgi:lysosomal-associated membrane protein 1/2
MMIYSSVLVLVFAISMVSSTSTQQEVRAKVEEPQWKVGDCILAHFSMNITIHHKDSNDTSIISIPESAKVDTSTGKSTCRNITANEDQDLVLNWKENDLNREIHIKFRRNMTHNYYGVAQFVGTFMMEKWKVNGTDFNTTVKVDSLEVPALLFHTPLDRSFTCSSWGSTKLKAVNTTLPSNIPSELQDSEVHTSNLEFDAFRNGQKTPPPAGFRDALDCEYQPNDIVPIAVGIALAALVIVVLIAYVVGRKRNRQRGYESV